MSRHRVLRRGKNAPLFMYSHTMLCSHCQRYRGSVSRIPSSPSVLYPIGLCARVWQTSKDAAAVAERNLGFIHQPSNYFYLVWYTCVHIGNHNDQPLCRTAVWDGVFPWVVIVWMNSFNASVMVILCCAKCVCVSSSSSQHGKLTLSPLKLIILPERVEATE